jgi:hypothetical protein
LSPALVLLSCVAILFVILLVLVLRDPRKLAKSGDDLYPTKDPDRRHLTYFRQVRQAIAQEDYVFLASRGSRMLTRRIRYERRAIALTYLRCLRNDFLDLWRLARVIASLSPQVGIGQEFARLRLGLLFYVRYEMVRIKFLCGFSPLPELGALNEAVSRLAVRLETAMNNLGERAALATKLASTLDGRGFNAS